MLLVYLEILGMSMCFLKCKKSVITNLITHLTDEDFLLTFLCFVVFYRKLTTFAMKLFDKTSFTACLFSSYMIYFI